MQKGIHIIVFFFTVGLTKKRFVEAVIDVGDDIISMNKSIKKSSVGLSLRI